MAWDWLWAGKVEQVVPYLDHRFLFGPGRKYCQVWPALSQGEGCTWPWTAHWEGSKITMTALSGLVPWQVGSFCSRRGKTWAVILLFHRPWPQLSCFAGRSRKTSLHPDPFPPPTFPVLLPSLWLLIFGWQSLVCGARAEMPSALTPACLLTGGAWASGGVVSFSVPLHPCVQKGVNLHPSFLLVVWILRTFLFQNVSLRN